MGMKEWEPRRPLEAASKPCPDPEMPLAISVSHSCPASQWYFGCFERFQMCLTCLLESTAGALVRERQQALLPEPSSSACPPTRLNLMRPAPLKNAAAYASAWKLMKAVEAMLRPSCRWSVCLHMAGASLKIDSSCALAHDNQRINCN